MLGTDRILYINGLKPKVKKPSVLSPKFKVLTFAQLRRALELYSMLYDNNRVKYYRYLFDWYVL